MPETLDLASRLADWSSRGPRYTSFPPATEFRPMAAELVRRELGAIGRANESVSLYVHVPFCRSLCAYCGCHVIPTRDPERGIGYVDLLATEMALVRRSLGEARVTEIALGGGSPNFLAPRTLRILVEAIERYFTVAAGARRSIELDPRSTTTAQIEALGDLGFRALSIGVQDFDEHVQDAIRRHQSIAQTRWLVERARANGFDDINLDVVYGLPLQTETSFAATLDAIIELAPDRVALFGYAHLPAKLPHQALVERAGRVLDPYERATLLLMAIARLADAGYLHLGLDHFARPGSRLARAAAQHRLARTFQGHVERAADAIVGLGTSAISSTRRMHWQNHARLSAWEAAIAAGELPTERGFVLEKDDRVRAALIERLMCDGAVDLERLGREHGLEPEVYFAPELVALEQLGELVRYDAERRAIQTTTIGRLLVRNVCMVFDPYRPPTGDEPRYSSTI
ncbi:MAG TPA: oxygen-independent coproporphyrinogen III oxidase [Kofleriaceae bacterium]|nr:oxygen-independent coproporphyrinogen III oxidase [Kofleriaceae bacterium]